MIKEREAGAPYGENTASGLTRVAPRVSVTDFDIENTSNTLRYDFSVQAGTKLRFV
jgi:hypothetical protein